MKAQRMQQVFGSIDEQFIAEAAKPAGFVNHRLFLRITAAAAAVALTIGIALWPRGEGHDFDTQYPGESGAIGSTSTTLETELATDTTTTNNTTTASTTKNQLFSGNTTTASTTKNNTTSTTKNQLFPGSTTFVKPTTTVEAIATIPRWENKRIYEKFPEIPYGDITYVTHGDTLPTKHIGHKLGEVTAKGQDVYTDTIHETTVSVYKLVDIAEECVVAVKYPGYDGYYPATNVWYRPQTLGQFITDLQLETHLTVGNVYEDGFEDGRYREITYEGLTKEAMWQHLLADTSLENVYDQQLMYGSAMSIGVKISMWGSYVSMWVTEDGYLVTNILGTGKAFHIGKDKVQTFMDYVRNHCRSTVRTLPTDSTQTTPDSGNKNTTTHRPANTVTGQTTQAYIPE